MKLLTLLFRPRYLAYAAEGTYTELDLERARKEEKDKLYKQLQDAQENERKANDALTKATREQAKLEKSIAELQVKVEKTIDPEAHNAALKELQDKLTEASAREEVLKQQLAEMPDAETLTAKLKTEYELKTYLAQKLSEHGDVILSVYKDTITGDTQDAIDAAIADAIAKSDKIREEIGAARKPNKKDPPPPPDGDSKPPKPRNQGSQTLAPGDIRNMSAADFAQFKQTSGLLPKNRRMGG